MVWITTLLLLFIGIGLIVKGGDIFVDAASWMAEKTGIPKVIVGATVVSVATTLPEMIVSFLAAAEGKVDIAIGNAIGSVTANIGLIMGIALICLPSVIKRRDYIIRSFLMIAATIVIFLFGQTGAIGVIPNILLISVFILAMADNVYQAILTLRQDSNTPGSPSSSQVQPDFSSISVEVDASKASGAIGLELGTHKIQTLVRREICVNIFKFIFGAGFIMAGSQILVNNGSLLAELLGVPDRIIAISIIAIGTSLPELVTTISAIAKKQSALSIGNIIGANIIDLTLILPISSLISSQALPISSQFALIDVPVCLIVGAVALIPTLFFQKFSRWQGLLMVGIYFAYLCFSIFMI